MMKYYWKLKLRKTEIPDIIELKEDEHSIFCVKKSIYFYFEVNGRRDDGKKRSIEARGDARA